MIIVLTLVLLLLLLFLGMPVGFALGIAGLVGMFLVEGFDGVYSIVYTVPYRTAASYTMTVIPMFVLMAQAVSASGLVAEVFTAARRWLERGYGGFQIQRNLQRLPSLSAGPGLIHGPFRVRYHNPQNLPVSFLS